MDPVTAGDVSDINDLVRNQEAEAISESRRLFGYTGHDASLVASRYVELEGALRALHIPRLDHYAVTRHKRAVQDKHYGRLPRAARLVLSGLTYGLGAAALLASLLLVRDRSVLTPAGPFTLLAFGAALLATGSLTRRSCRARWERLELRDCTEVPVLQLQRANRIVSTLNWVEVRVDKFQEDPFLWVQPAGSSFGFYVGAWGEPALEQQLVRL